MGIMPPLLLERAIAVANEQRLLATLELLCEGDFLRGSVDREPFCHHDWIMKRSGRPPIGKSGSPILRQTANGRTLHSDHRISPTFRPAYSIAIRRITLVVGKLARIFSVRRLGVILWL